MFARFLRSNKILSFWLLFSMREEISELKKAFKNFQSFFLAKLS
jgi:hypothetical protein